VRTPSPTCRKCGAPRDPNSRLAMCEPCRRTYERERAEQERRDAGVKPRSKATTCKVCGGPRTNRNKYALCETHLKERLTRRMRVVRGIPLDAPYRAVAHDPRLCVNCDQPRVSGSYCREHANEKARMWAQKRGRMSLEERRQHQKENPKVKTCKARGCESPTATTYGKYCSVCSEQRRMGRSTKEKLTKAAKQKQMAPPAPRWNTAFSGKGLGESAQKPVEINEIVIGPQAIEVVKPVDIRGHKVTRVPAAGEWGR